MDPITICQHLGKEKLDQVLAKLSSPQIKAVLKEGGIKVKFPGGIVTQKRRRAIWLAKINDALASESQPIAGELLQQWLLNHHRSMLVAYLDLLDVKHQAGETDQSFLSGNSPDKLREAALKLLADFDPLDVRAYLHYIAHQQESTVFAGWEPLDFPSPPDVPQGEA